MAETVQDKLNEARRSLQGNMATPGSEYLAISDLIDAVEMSQQALPRFTKPTTGEKWETVVGRVVDEMNAFIDAWNARTGAR
jgi:hypothetical protein